MTKTIEEILAPKPAAPLHLYACSTADAAHKGLLKVGQILREVKRRVAARVREVEGARP